MTIEQGDGFPRSRQLPEIERTVSLLTRDDQVCLLSLAKDVEAMLDKLRFLLRNAPKL